VQPKCASVTAVGGVASAVGILTRSVKAGVGHPTDFGCIFWLLIVEFKPLSAQKVAKSPGINSHAADLGLCENLVLDQTSNALR